MWDPRELPIQRVWFSDGPFAKLEFARHSKDDRITIVLEKNALPVRTLWAVMDATDIKDAKKALRSREGCNLADIGTWSKGQDCPLLLIDVPEWANARGVDSLVWTALPSKFNGTDKKTPTVEDVISHLSRLTGTTRDNAEQYLRFAPRQVDTAYRRRIEAALHWTPQDSVAVVVNRKG